MTNDDGTTFPRFTTRQDAIDQAILPALDRFAHHYDVDAIFDEAFEWCDGQCTQVVTVERFWVIVGRHDKTAR